MSVFITQSSMVSCLGDAEATVAGLFAGSIRARELTHPVATRMRVATGYPLGRRPLDRAWSLIEPHIRSVCRELSSEKLTRTIILVGTGMHEQRSIELAALFPEDGGTARALFPHMIASAGDSLEVQVPVITLSGACSASGTALALGQDILEQDLADQVVVAGGDVMSLGMMGMMGRMNPRPPDRLTPFDRGSAGVLLGEGAGAVLLTHEAPKTDPVIELLATAINCDAVHETSPDPKGITTAIRNAHERAGIQPRDVDLVVAHATGTALNDPTEAACLGAVFGDHRPRITAIKGATGHTSGASMLMSLVIAMVLLRRRLVPPVVGLSEPIPEAAALNFPHEPGAPLRTEGELTAQIEGFGFGGANAVCLIRTKGATHGDS